MNELRVLRETVNDEEGRVVPLLSRHILDDAAVKCGIWHRRPCDTERGAAVGDVCVHPRLHQHRQSAFVARRLTSFCWY